jgi:DNA polymerase-3 subunit delta
VKANRAEIERALDRPSDDIRCILLHGPDEAGSRALADRLGKAMGADAERIDLDGATLAKDPALLSDEAASTSLFGGARWIRVRASGDEVTDAVESLLSAPQAGNPVAIIAGALKPTSKLLKLALASTAVPAFASYAPEGREAGQMVIAMGTALGLRIAPDIARRIFDAAAADRAIVAQELEKIAAFLDADEGSPREVDSDVLEAIGAGEGGSNAGALVDAVLTGAVRPAVEELKQLVEAGEEGIPLVRTMFRRLLLLAALRAEADRTSIDAAMNGAAARSIFWKEKATIEAELRRWSASDLAMLVDRITSSQARLMESGSAGAVNTSQELLTIARAAAGRGR